jgi:hypothetical protein
MFGGMGLKSAPSHIFVKMLYDKKAKGHTTSPMAAMMILVAGVNNRIQNNNIVNKTQNVK